LFGLVGAAVGSKFLPASADIANTHSKTTPGSFTLFYKPEKTGNNFDTWIYYHKGQFYLYYQPVSLSKKTSVGWDCVALATSSDGVHWQEYGRIITATEGLVCSGAVGLHPIPVAARTSS